MDWLFNHLFVLLIVAGAVASMVQKAKRAGTQQQARKVLDEDAAERTRRVQEEIRRKIAERAGRMPVSPAPVPSLPAAGMSPPSPGRNIFQELARQMAETKRLAEARERERAGAEVQTQLRAENEQKSRDLAEVQRTMQKQQEAAATEADYGAAGLKTTAAIDVRKRLLADLREPDSLRRAWVLREILGAPVGLP